MLRFLCANCGDLQCIGNVVRAHPGFEKRTHLNVEEANKRFGR